MNEVVVKYDWPGGRDAGVLLPESLPAHIVQPNAVIRTVGPMVGRIYYIHVLRVHFDTTDGTTILVVAPGDQLPEN